MEQARIDQLLLHILYRSSIRVQMTFWETDNTIKVLDVEVIEPIK